MKSKALVLVFITLTLLPASCGMRGEDAAVVLITVGDATITGAGGDRRAVKVGDVIKKDDTIATGPKSHVSIQLGASGIIQVAQNSTIKALSLFNEGSCEFFLGQGKALSRIDKLAKGGGYRVKTPTAIAAVRGTVFSVSYYGGISAVATAKGVVQVTHSATGTTEDVPMGKAAEVKEAIELRDISGVEKLELEKVEIISLEKNLLGGEVSLEEKTGGYIPKFAEIDEEIENLTPLSLNTIREKFGRIDVVTLYSGKVYQGAILSRGGYLQMVTAAGKISIPAGKVKTTNSW